MSPMTRRLSLLLSFAQTLIHVVRLAAAIAVEERDPFTAKGRK